jgi:hypothetical protein
MIKLSEIAREILSGGNTKNLFGSLSNRVTTEEMHGVFGELKKKLAKKFSSFNNTTKLSSRQDHGDIDIVVVPPAGQSTKDIIINAVGTNIVRNTEPNPIVTSNGNVYQPKQMYVTTNGNIFSILYRPDKLDKQVHIDFIVAKDEEDARNKQDYLAYNDFSGIVGVISRKLGFKYGSDGFFKIFVDKKGQNRFIFITKNLRDAQKILGFRKVDTNFSNIKSEDDIIEYIKTSPLFDIRQLSGELNNGDRKKMRSERQSAQYIRDQLLQSGQRRTVDDDDYFFKSLFPSLYDQVEKEKQKLDTDIINTEKYTGEWIINTFNLKPGKVIGQVKDVLNKEYGDNLNNTPEDQVINTVKQYLSTI